jgi:outer membrane protein TolC
MKRVQTLWLIFFAFSALKAPLGAQETLMLTLEDACERAVQADTELQKEGIDLGLAKTKAGAVWAEFFPSLSVGAGMSYDIPLSGSSSDPRYSADAGLSLGFNAGIPFTLKNNSLDYRIRLAAFENNRRSLIIGTSKNFDSLLAQGKKLEVLESARILAEEQLQRDRVARQSGYMGELDFLSSSLSAETARLEYSSALSNYSTALGKFLVTLGLEPEGSIKLDGTIDVARFSGDTEALVAAALPKRLDLLIQRHEIERQKNRESEAVFSSRGPSLNLRGSWGISYPGGPDKTIGTSLSLSIPLNSWIPNTKENQSLKSAAAEVEKARLDLKNKENTARTEIHSLVLSLQNGWNEVETARLRVGIAERVYELSDQGYRRGTLNFLDFETVRNRLTAARQQLLQSENDYKLLFLDLAGALSADEEELKGFMEERIGG